MHPTEMKPAESMIPGYYRVCLGLTVFECVVAFTVALTPWINLLPFWMTMPDAKDPTYFAQCISQGYGFWAGMWAIPNFVILKSSHVPTVRLFAKLAGLLYLLWWFMWWEQLWTWFWVWYAMVVYIPLRAYQMGANLWYGFRGAKS